MVAYSFYEMDNRVRRYAETLVEKGWHVDAIALNRGKQKKKEIIKGVTLYRIQDREINERGKFSYFFRIVKFLLKSTLFLSLSCFKKPYDLIHVHSVPDFEVFAALLPKIFGSKIILDIHDIVPEFYAEKFSAGNSTFISTALLWMERFSCFFSNHVIISNDIWYKKLVQRSVRLDKCTVILNYPVPSLFHKRDNALHPHQPEFVILYPGTFAWHQGLDIAIQAIARIKKAKNVSRKIQLHLYGKGPEEENLKKIAEHLGVTDVVLFKGMLSIEEMAERMAYADLGLVPKRDGSFGGQAFSTKILEFMALGVPQIVSKTTIDQYYFNDDLVEFFTPEDVQELSEKIMGLADDETRRNELIKNGLEYIEKNNWNVKQNEYLTIVKSLAGE
ncbi:glycosyltransferase family 4 protein [Desulfopila sp. IMCC35006]|uniref:glycosyltransferase family 4 protein n=1 Tax=Desulfopila sp. IMCC35006 TaxID=2569542 RepID=UPI00142EF1FE|nr:glycosyltransferase family 4 protein [Desulfopila sp. IMCC35006]